jgi:hypothetical protein
VYENVALFMIIGADTIEKQLKRCYCDWQHLLTSAENFYIKVLTGGEMFLAEIKIVFL